MVIKELEGDLARVVRPLHYFIAVECQLMD
jgi:hypothetical protein